MYLKRKVYDQLLDWKNDTVHSTLEVNGARQVGKHILSINLRMRTSGTRSTLTCLICPANNLWNVTKSHRLDSRYKTTGAAASRCF